MARLACVDVAALPLQLLLRGHTAWRLLPVAVVAHDRPQAPVLWVNAAARQQGVRPGMRQAEALSLAAGLRAAVVPAGRVRAGVAGLTALLRRFSPHVEPSPEEPGVFWLDASGLARLAPSPQAWAAAIREALAAAGFQARLALGFAHFGCYALARSGRGVAVFADPAAERRAAREAPLATLGLEPRTREALAQLGIATLGELLRLPAAGLLARFGPRVYRLHRLAAGQLADPLQPAAERLPAHELIVPAEPLADAAQALFLIAGRLPFLLATLAGRQEALQALRLRLLLDDGTHRDAEIAPAAPTREPRPLVDLLRLRLERMRLSAGVREIELWGRGAGRALEQLTLPTDPPGRDLAAANRALAQLRAELGEQAVVRAVLREGHLPQARFAWEPLAEIERPRPRPASGPVARQALVRRIYGQPKPLPGWPREPAQWRYDRAPAADSLVALHGPYAVNGGWWAGDGAGQHRDFYYAETREGALLWLCHDRRRGRWFLQGRVE
ncbi:MAG: DNA polymerase Y family protein [Candidatus Lambdaproteobacteria bacterium]|nr:DNA polymerase Y family protein [Candidatus Lambdaproteobacteria bacterium]